MISISTGMFGFLFFSMGLTVGGMLTYAILYFVFRSDFFDY